MPAEYGTVGPERLPWGWAAQRLSEAMVYWLATVGADGAPHVRPVDGSWTDNALFIGGSSEAAWIRNMARDQRVTVHLADPRSVVIVEGTAHQVVPDERLASRIATASGKYAAMYGPSSAATYLGQPVWAIRPGRVIGWERFPTDATRWVFERH